MTHPPIAPSPLRRGSGIFCFGLCLATLLAGCAPLADDEAQQLRIVSLNPCSDAILAEIAPHALVAVSHYSHDPRASSMNVHAARQWPATGGTVEEIVALQPDVVVASSFIAPATANALDRLGLRVERVGIASTVAASADQVRQLAAIAAVPEQGEALVRRLDAPPPPAGPRPSALVWQSGGIVAGPDSLVAAMLEQAGFANHAAARGLGQGAYLPLEAVLADPPDVIIAAGGERALTHPALRNLSDTHYAALDPALLYCGGPTIPKLAARLSEIRRELARAR